MHYRISHQTRYSYDAPASLSHNEVRLQPLQSDRQSLLSWSLHLDPAPEIHLRRHDSFGNHVDYFSIQHPHSSLVITAVSEVSVLPPRPPAASCPLAWEEVSPALRRSGLEADIEARLYALASPLVPLAEPLHRFALAEFTPGRHALEAIASLNHRIFSEFSFDPHFSHVATPILEAFHARRGVCQDFAQILIGCLRSLGIPARYISGYLETLPPPGGEKLIGADASHAWVSAYLPGLGWIDFDPTNDLQPSEQHLTVARGRDYADITPVRGITLGGSHQQLTVEVDVTRLATVSQSI